MSRVFSTRFGSCGWVVVLLVLPALAGCGKRTAVVSGQVTYQGQPVPSGAVTFFGSGGLSDSSSLDAEGNYTLSQAPVGTVKVTVVTGLPSGGPPVIRGPSANKDTVTSRSPKHPGGEPKPGRHPGTGPAAARHVVLPKKYEDPDQSGLTFTVTGGKQTINIPLN
jgi:hypothetical protein